MTNEKEETEKTANRVIATCWIVFIVWEILKWIFHDYSSNEK